MKIEKCRKESFCVIGKEGSTKEGDGFIQRLWQEANEHFEEIREPACKDENGYPVGIWGAMSDFSRSFQPWENFRKGLYLAGPECAPDAEAPAGWTKWIIPAYEYLRVENEDSSTFSGMLEYMKENGLSLAGAVHDFTDPRTGKHFMYFPIRKL